MRPLLLIAVLAVIAPRAYPAERWQLRYFNEADDASLAINDLRFITPERGIAVGASVDSRTGKMKPAGLVTADGGRTWSELRMPDIGTSLFFFDADLGWMAGASGIWRTTSLGREWKKVQGARGLQAICFADRERGWAVGARGAAYETTSGGKDWKEIKLPVAEKPLKIGTEKLGTVVNYSSVACAEGNFGAIGGAVEPRELPFDASRRVRGQPPEVADGFMLQLAKTVLLTTHDGGKSWESGLSVSGRVLQVRLTPAKMGLLVMEAAIRYDSWLREGLLSTVAGMRLTPGAAPTVHNPPERIMITDVHLAQNGIVYVAGYDPPGVLAHSLVPGRLKVFRSAGGRRWTEIPADYRAAARRVVLAPAGNDLWLATDTGMILKLVTD